ncbi:MAG: hypothetical protein RR314_02980 [Oscillospiraceae bacterium]
MIFDLINMQKLRRGAIYAVYMLLVLALQELVLSRLSFFGVHTLVVPAAVVAVGMLEGGVWGGVFGLFAGLLCDMTFGNTALFAALFPAIGFFSGLLARYFVNKRFFAYMAVCLLGLAVTAFFQFFRLWVFMDQPFGPLFVTALLQTLWSLPFAALLYSPCKGIAGVK